MHSGIVEVQLPIEAKLKNIEETERAKRRCMATVAQSLVLLCFEEAQHTQLRIHSATASPQPQPELQRSRWRPLSATAQRARCWVKQHSARLRLAHCWVWPVATQYSMLQQSATCPQHAGCSLLEEASGAKKATDHVHIPAKALNVVKARAFPGDACSTASHALSVAMIYRIGYRAALYFGSLSPQQWSAQRDIPHSRHIGHNHSAQAR